MAQMESLCSASMKTKKKVKKVEYSCMSVTSLFGLEGSEAGKSQGDSALTRQETLRFNKSWMESDRQQGIGEIFVRLNSRYSNSGVVVEMKSVDTEC